MRTMVEEAVARSAGETVEDVELSISQSKRHLWWLLAGIAVLSLFLIGMAMWWVW